MPDALSILYKQNKAIQKENRNAESGDSGVQDFPMADKIYVPQNVSPIDQNRPIDVTAKNVSQFGNLEDYYKYINRPYDIEAGGDVNRLRAQNQSGWEQLGNAAVRFIPDVIMGTVSNLAAIADVEDYANVDDEVGNSVSNLMTEWQDIWKAKNPIYRENPGTSFDVGDSGWWIDNISNLADSAGAFMATGYITGGILGGLAKGLRSGKVAPKALAKMESVVADEIAAGRMAPEAAGDALNAMRANYVGILDKATVPMNAIALNQAESIMEGIGVYKDVYNQKVAAGDDIETAKQKAADAAALDVNINRANILLNLTSAGMFTNANKAIKQSMGTAFSHTAKESVQEAAEEGVNYIAQMEAMQQAKDGPNYQFDTNRALGHLATAQGAEAMFLGALGGAVQTGGTQLINGMKERGQSAHNDVTQATSANNPAAIPQTQYMLARSNNVNQWFSARKNAQTPEDIDTADSQYLHNDATSLYLQGHDKKGKEGAAKNIDPIISEYDRIRKLDIAKELKDNPNLDQADLTSKVELAEKAYNTLINVKNIADSADLHLYPYNKSEVLSKAIELDTASKALSSSLQALNAKSNTIASQNPTMPVEALKSKQERETVAEKAQYESDLAVHEEISNDLGLLKSPAHQSVVAEQFLAKKEKEKEAQQNASVQQTAATVPQVSPTTRPVVAPKPVVSDINNAIAKTVISEDVKPVGEDLTRDIDEQQLNTLTKGENSPTILLDENGTDGYLVMPTRPLESNPEIITPARVIKVGKNSDGSLQLVGAVKSALQHTDTIPDAKVTIGDIKFARPELDSFLQGRTDKDGNPKTSNNFTRADLLDFINSKTTTSNANAKVVPSHTIEDIDEPQAEPTPSEISEVSGGTDSSKREDPRGVNFLSAKYKIVDNKLVNTGEINQQYLVNSDKSLVKAGAEVIIRPYTENQVPTVNYDADGVAIVKDGEKTVTNHDANTALQSGREIPIGIYLKNPNGSEGQLIGFLPETAWMNEGGEGNRFNLAESDVDATTEMINQVIELRNHITEQFKTNKSITVSSKIKSTTSGKPFINPEGFQSVAKALPELSKDNKGKPVFGYIKNGTVWANGNAINNVVNEDKLTDPKLIGRAVVLLPIGDGTFYAMIAKSGTLAELNSVGYITEAINASIGTNGNGASIYDAYAKKNGKESITTHEGLREYIKQFIHLNSIAEWGNPAIADKNAISIWEKDGKTIIRFGTNNSGNPSTITDLKNAKPEQLSELKAFLGQLRHSFSPDNLNDKSEIFGITKGGMQSVAKNIQERYLNTVQTNVLPAGKFNGKTIYMIQPVIEIDTTLLVVSPQPLTAGEQITRDMATLAQGAVGAGARNNHEQLSKGKEVIYSKPETIELLKKDPLYNIEIQSDGSAKVIGVKHPDTGEWAGIQPVTKTRVKKAIIPTTGDASNLLDANPTSQSIGLEAPTTLGENPISNISPSNADEQGEALIKYCKG